VNPKIGARYILQLMILLRINSSPIKFGKGGRPRFAAQLISHHIGISEVISFKPRDIEILRVFLRS
uniref:hypothetical protein n=1 Tax=Salmonella sp. s54496 TaxID=3159665 RepID=UPI003981911D